MVSKFSAKKNMQEVSNIFADQSFSSGKNYWCLEVSCSKMSVEGVRPEDETSEISVGIAKDGFNHQSYPEDGNYWGILPFMGTAVTPSTSEKFSYPKQPSKDGTKIGVLLEYKKERATIKFSIDDFPLDVQFDNLSGTFTPVVCFISTLGQATILPLAKPCPGL